MGTMAHCVKTVHMCDLWLGAEMCTAEGTIKMDAPKGRIDLGCELQ
jgi:hypothetical protein